MFEGSEYAYYGMYLIGFAIMMLVNLKTHKKYEFTKKTAVIFTLITYVAGVTGAMIMGSAYTALIERFDAGSSSVAIFGAVVFTPVFMIITALLFGKSWRKVMDMLAPGIFIILTCAKFGCFMAGCCPGRECSFGVYNPKLELTVFPSQLFESITMCFVVAFCFWYGFKYKKARPGSVYPVTAAVYSVTRFCWEFMRYYKHEEMRRLVLGMTFWQFWCIVVIIASAGWILLLKSKKLEKLEVKCNSFANAKTKPFIDKVERFKHRNDKNIVHHKKKK
ncbi:MAG: prolipoprotein diacylglyceryl transferase [Clostridia bacterium]|nr:prolipoprotein diacylglyceryl transferase [Clostridia bacterium]